MTVSGALARPLLAGIFIYGGWDSLRDPEGKAKAADDVAPMIAETLGLPTTDTVTLVRINGGVQVVAGSLLALGKFRRLSALVLAASLLPTTYAGHRFWEEVDEERRAHQRIQFLKNAAMLGGLIVAAGDTGGRPSVTWQARRAAQQARRSAAQASQSAAQVAKQAVDQASEITMSAVGQASGLGRQTAQLVHAARPSDLASRVGDIGAGAEKAMARARKAAQQARQSELADQARKLAQAAKDSDLSRRAFKSARKAAKEALEEAAKAELGRRALKAAKQAAKKAEKARDADVTSRALRAAQTAANRAREAAADGGVDRFREATATLARELADRAKEVLPVAS